MAKKGTKHYIRADALWILKHVFGYTTREIAAGAHIDVKTLDNAISGTYPLSDEATRNVASYLGILKERLVDFPSKRT